uniref:Beta-defensin n=1 Tax=Balaenoptera musculus TaxID=9771 RepID=A0A8C0D794_BALMU
TKNLRNTYTILSGLSFYFSAYGGGKKCWHNSGHCRKKCNVDEIIKAVCKNHQSCCVPDQGQMSSDKKATTSPASIYGSRGDAMDRIVTVVSATTNWE